MFKQVENNFKPKQLIGIQYLRAAAVLFVVLDHTTGMAMLPKYFGVNFNIFNGWFESGASGVDLFFVISGFIIVYVSLNDESLTPKINTSSFLKHRFTRIIPFLWVCIIGYALLKLVGRGDFPAMDYLRSMTLFPIGKLEPPVVWTLRHEFLFYLLFATFIIHFKSKWYWLTGWFLSSFLLPLLLLILRRLHVLPNPSLRDLCDFLFSLHNLTFGIGALIGVLYKKNYLNFILETRFGFLLALIIAIPLLLAANATGMIRASETFTQVLSCSIISGIIVLFGICLFTIKPLSYFDRLGLLLGDASYSIYLTHSAVLSAMLGIWSKHQPHTNPLLLLITGCIASLAGGIFAHFFIEKPLIKLIRRKVTA